MVSKESLTNEKIKKKFNSQFELVGHAIALVDNMVKSGRAPRVKSLSENPAVLVLEEIEQGKDSLEMLPMDVPVATAVATTYAIQEVETPKAPEKKAKSRRILQ